MIGNPNFLSNSFLFEHQTVYAVLFAVYSQRLRGRELTNTNFFLYYTHTSSLQLGAFLFIQSNDKIVVGKHPPLDIGKTQTK